MAVMPTALTQRVANAAPPLDRPDLVPSATSTSRKRKDAHKQTLRRRMVSPIERREVIERWEGEVLSIDAASETFTARLVDLNGRQVDRDVRFPLGLDMSEAIHPGAVFRYSVVAVRDNIGPSLERRFLTRFQFEQPEPLTSDDIEAAKSAAAGLVALTEDG